jgi:hypothetical protein
MPTKRTDDKRFGCALLTGKAAEKDVAVGRQDGLTWQW